MRSLLSSGQPAIYQNQVVTVSTTGSAIYFIARSPTGQASIPSTPLIHLYFHSFLLLPALPAHPSPPLHNSLYSKNLPSIICSCLRHRAELQRWLLLKPHPNDGPRRSGGGGGKQAGRQAMAYIYSSGPPRLQLDSVSVGSNIARPTSRLTTYAHTLCLLRQLSPPYYGLRKAVPIYPPRLASPLFCSFRLGSYIANSVLPLRQPARPASIYKKNNSRLVYTPQPAIARHSRHSLSTFAPEAARGLAQKSHI